MKIWQLQSEVDKYDNIIPLIPFSADEIQAFDGRRHSDTWKTRKVKRLEPEKGLELSDMPGFTIPVFSKRALSILRSIIEDEVEILVLDFEEEEIFAINVIDVVDAIDYEKSKYTKFKNGKILAFEKYTFISEKVMGKSIFKISDENCRRAFVSDEFKRLVEENHLTGFKFKLVWDSEEN